jgi:hypothetical protein
MLLLEAGGRDKGGGGGRDSSRELRMEMMELLDVLEPRDELLPPGFRRHSSVCAPILCALSY